MVFLHSLANSAMATSLLLRLLKPSIVDHHLVTLLESTENNHF